MKFCHGSCSCDASFTGQRCFPAILFLFCAFKMQLPISTSLFHKMTLAHLMSNLDSQQSSSITRTGFGEYEVWKCHSLIIPKKKMSLWFGFLYLNIQSEVSAPWHLHDLYVTSDNKCRCSSRHNNVKPGLHLKQKELNPLQMTPVCSGFNRLLSALFYGALLAGVPHTLIAGLISDSRSCGKVSPAVCALFMNTYQSERLAQK